MHAAGSLCISDRHTTAVISARATNRSLSAPNQGQSKNWVVSWGTALLPDILQRKLCSYGSTATHWLCSEAQGAA